MVSKAAIDTFSSVYRCQSEQQILISLSRKLVNRWKHDELKKKKKSVN